MRYSILLLGALAAPAFAATIDIKCAGRADPVGRITVDKQGQGISGSFKSLTGTPPSLAAAAAACDEHHFNWYQIITSDNGRAKDAAGNFLTAPYVDPPPGGYQGQWADKLPWYWDETPNPNNANDPYQLSKQTTADTLKFSDSPNTAGKSISFKTWLVSLNADSSFHSWHEGFSWVYETGKGVTSITSLGEGKFPTDAEYKDLLKGFVTAVPEPEAWALWGLSLALVAGVRAAQRKGIAWRSLSIWQRLSPA